MAQSLTCLVFHLVFSTKDRRKLILPHFRSRLYDFTGGIIRRDKGTLIAAGGVDDHIHILGQFDKNITIPTVVRNIKSLSAGWIHDTFPEMSIFSWQSGYAAFTLGMNDISFVKLYIANQENHHRKVTFQDELRTLLQAHEIEGDEKYLWE